MCIESIYEHTSYRKFLRCGLIDVPAAVPARGSFKKALCDVKFTQLMLQAGFSGKTCRKN